MRDVYKLVVHVKPNDRPLVWRSEAERVLGAARFGARVVSAQTARATQPDVMALEERWREQRSHGTRAQEQ